jgi:MYXO-CTERM domain-containing protein
MMRSFGGIAAGTVTKFVGFSVGSGPSAQYGWVELQISQPGGRHTPYTVTVVEAALEQCAGQSIQAGATSGGANCSVTPPATPAPNSLWLLALGAAGLAGLELLRRRRTA